MPDLNKVKLRQLDSEITSFVNGLINQGFTGSLSAFLSSGYFGATVVYASGGNQTILGTKNFSFAPQVPYSGAANQTVSQQYVLDKFNGVINNVVYTTGNQAVGGLKFFSDLTVPFPTGQISVPNVAYFDSRGIVYNTGDQSITGIKTFASPIIGAVAPTGTNNFIRYIELAGASGALQAQIGGGTLSGFLEAQIVGTGAKITTLSGFFQTQLAATGVKITALSGQLIVSGDLLNNRIISSSGFAQAQLNYITGIAIPTGGTVGQVLGKLSSNNYDNAWINVSGGGGNGNVSSVPSTPTLETLTYASDGDTSGVCYRIGTNFGAQAWSNPHTAGRLTVVRSSDGGGTATDLVDRAVNNTFSNNSANSWIVIDLGPTKSLILNKYSLRNRTFADRAIRNWKIQGTNFTASNSISDLAAATWTDIETRTNDTTMAAIADQFASYDISGTPLAYRWIRIFQNGVNSTADNYLTLAEIEFYGDFSYAGGFASVDGEIALFDGVGGQTIRRGPVLLMGSGILNFPNTFAGESSDLNLTLSGVEINDSLFLGVHPDAILPNSSYSAWVSGSGQVAVRFNNYYTGIQNPTSGMFTVTVFH